MDELLAAAEADNYDISLDTTQEEEAIAAASPEFSNEGSLETEVDDKALTCRVIEFFPEENKLCYRIENENNLPHFKKRGAVVLRKFEDFDWLHDRLNENHDLDGVLIPHLPPKVTWVDVVESQTSQKVLQPQGDKIRLLDQFQRRALQLQRFLRYVCRHKKLRQDIHFVVFLEYEDDLRPKITKSWFDSIASRPVLLLPDDPPGILPEVYSWIKLYKERLEPVVKAADELSFSIRSLAALERVALQEFHDWPKEDESLSELFFHMSKGFAKSQLQHHYRAEIKDMLYDLLLDHTGVLVATEDLFARRYKSFVRVQEAEKAFKKAGANRALEPSHPGNEQAVRALDDCETAVTKSKEHLESVNQTAADELELARKRRMADFKAVFIRLAELEIIQSKQRQDEWQIILDGVKELGEGYEEQDDS
eukprot:m.339265 g.339265  ORF g.339265 m.339265 type:complete len:423 (+) comp18726_c0_seq1:186-1454(+)